MQVKAPTTHFLIGGYIVRFSLRNSGVAFLAASLLGVTLVACAGGSSAIPPGSQIQSVPSSSGSNLAAPASAMQIIAITSKDRAAVKSHGNVSTHAWYVKKFGGSGVTAQSVVHPSNLEYFGGALITSAHIYNAFVDGTSTPFGDVAQFESRLSRSTFIHITDEYVHTAALDRYGWHGNFGVIYPAVTTLGDNDLLLIIHAVAAGIAGGGHHNIYNIFLAPGLNYCGTGTLIPVGACAATATSPNPAFCSFHGAVTFRDTGDTLFTVQPYTSTAFCGVDNATARPTAPTPNGLQIDSLFSALSHEQIEVITDPDPGTGWVNPAPFYPAEIGDLCAFELGQFDSRGFVVPQNTTLDGKAYRIQWEYSNKQIGCANSPP